MKVAIVHDWLYVYGGAERVLESLITVWPNADLFSLIDFVPPEQRDFLQGKKVKTSFVQSIPGAKRFHRQFLPLMAIAIEQFDFSDYDLVVSSSYAVAKGILTGPNQVHVCYCHSPMRYAWDLQTQYLQEARCDKGIKGILARILLHKMRIWDTRTAFGVDHFIANSKFVARRIKKTYGRNSEVIYPPVDISAFSLSTERKNYYLVACRLAPYKRVDILVKAFAKMPEKKLIIIGDGPERKSLMSLATDNIEFRGLQFGQPLYEAMQSARAFLYAGIEDFGIVPVEAQACGTPVVAYAAAGILETVKGLGRTMPGEQPTGVLFDEQTPQALCQAIELFEAQEACFCPHSIRAHALSFGRNIFEKSMQTSVQTAYENNRLCTNYIEPNSTEGNH